MPKNVLGHVVTQLDPERKYPLTQEVQLLVEDTHVKQLDVQRVQTDETETYPAGQVNRQVLLGLREYRFTQERQYVASTQL